MREEAEEEPAGSGRTAGRSRSLLEIARILDLPAPAGDVRVGGISYHSGQVDAGDLFFAVPGTRVDGHDYLDQAVRRGAAAAVVEREVAGASVPQLRVPDVRQALARLAAAWFDWPANRLTLVGITGTLGKTSVLSMLESILLEDGQEVGVIGSLGMRLQGSEHPTGHTAPDPITLHASLAAIAEAGSRIAAMEVTSHAIDQERVHGLRFALGIFTNLVPLEHTDYHGSFRAYAQVKRRFLDLLEEGAPLVYNADDRAVCALARGHPSPRGAGVGRTRAAAVRVEPRSVSASGSRLYLHLSRPLPLLSGGVIEPRQLEIALRLLGRGNVANAALAATAALMLGASEGAVRGALERLRSPRRRMELFELDGFQVLDDTVGHPDSISAVFEVAEALAPRRLHVVFAIRGGRGARINRRTAEALAIWAQRHRPATVVTTASEGSVGESDEVTSREREAFTTALERAGVGFEEVPRLEPAVGRVLEAARPGDLVMLLGAQGMDPGGDIARGEAAS